MHPDGPERAAKVHDMYALIHGVGGENTGWLPQVLQADAEILQNNGHTDEALTMYYRAFDLSEETFPEDFGARARILRDVSWGLIAKDSPDGALEVLTGALELHGKALDQAVRSPIEQKKELLRKKTTEAYVDIAEIEAGLCDDDTQVERLIRYCEDYNENIAINDIYRVILTLEKLVLTPPQISILESAKNKMKLDADNRSSHPIVRVSRTIIGIAKTAVRQR